jgi:hypothetical protein
MGKDISETINVLRNTAVGRCRERLEQAAQKAKGFINDDQTLDRSDMHPPCSEQYGVTSLMKRKHGL